MSRPFNFAPGPAALPEAVLQKAASEMLDWHGSGMSVMEMSHRGSHFSEIHEMALTRFRRLLGLGSEHEVLFVQGGATAQNAIVPMNLLGQVAWADYVNTGHWSTKSIQEAHKYGDIRVAATAEAPPADRPEQQPFTYIPDPAGWTVRAKATYLHICGNETIHGVEYAQWPDLAALGAPDVSLVVDMSSHILSRPMDFSQVALAYGGAQKNIGPSGLTFVILRRDLIEEKCPRPIASCPSLFDYRRVLEQNSLLNTPSTFAIYMAGLVFEWLEAQGGVEVMGQVNRQKAEMVYGAIDGSGGFYRNQVATSARSLMNIPFQLADERLYEPFLEQAKAAGLLNLKGHKAVGGLRASLYNAVPLEGVRALVDFMAAFQKEQG